jgi:hypothetical protein
MPLRETLTAAAIPLAILALAALGGCKASGAGGACQAAGGQCFLGTFRPSCHALAPDADQDCNPEENPGGGFCCMSEPEDAAPATDGGDAGGRDAGPE